MKQPRLSRKEWDLIHSSVVASVSALAAAMTIESVHGNNSGMVDLHGRVKALAEKIGSALSEQPAVFPVEYKGWRIEIRMGREFKGARGSVKTKRGYVATRLSDGRVQEFPPSYDSTPSLKAVRCMIDAEERAKELYKP